jgi:AcrR family transcriptional regulator
MPRITEARRNAQRARVVDAALVCFDRNGFHRTTMQDIVFESGLSPGAIYGYFDGKMSIVEAVAAERHDLERKLLSEALKSRDPIAGMITFVEKYFEWLGDPQELRRRRLAVQVWAEALHDPQMRSSVATGLAPLADVARAIRNAKRRKRIASTVNPEGLARVLLAMIQGFVLQQAWQPDVDIKGYRDTVLAMLVALDR